MKTEIYSRHRSGCPNSSNRNAFDGCPIYARYVVRDLHSGAELERFHGSLKGITNETAAREYIENRFILLRNGLIKPAKNSKTVAEAVELYIADKRRELPAIPFGEVSPYIIRGYARFGKSVPTTREHEIVVRLIRALRKRFVEFCDQRQIKSICDVEYEHLTEFLSIRYGRTVSVVENGEIVGRKTLPPEVSSQRADQSLMSGWFRWLHDHEYIEKNPAAKLRPIKSAVVAMGKQKDDVLPWRREMIEKVLDTIPSLHTRPQRLTAFFKIMVFSAARITDITCMEVDRLDNTGIEYWNRKTGGWVYAALPPSLIRFLRTGFRPCSAKYFFWNGRGDPQRKSAYFGMKLRQVYRAAGIPEVWEGGPRNHDFRDTTATLLVEREGGTLEDAQLALNHKRRETTQRHYEHKTQVRYAKVNEKKQAIWEELGLWD